MTLITPEYLALQKQLHQSNDQYGISGAKYADIVRQISNWGRVAILDYGCGRQTLSKALGPAYRVTNYDPCIEGLDTPPDPHPVVACTDVLEHIEPELVDNVLAELRRLTQRVALLVINTGPAKKVLADGRNAHISMHPQEWWLERIKAAGFEVTDHFDEGIGTNTFGVIVI
jgi:2-polyprenyl-3-methyl-5-hydroxy-6-metoxy-1,4-benzoquinol methylase